MELYKQKISSISEIPILNCKAINYVFENNLVA